MLYPLSYGGDGGSLPGIGSRTEHQKLWQKCQNAQRAQVACRAWS